MIHHFGSLSYQYHNNETSKDYFGGEYDETDLMLKYFKIQPGDVFIDIGAHIGTWTLAALAMGASHVYAFDPYKEMFDILKENVRLNGWSERLTAIEKGLSSISQREMFYKIPKYKPRENLYEVDFIPLDSYDFKKIDWIKIDVEGMELAVLRGAINTISKHFPKMIIEIHDSVIKEIIPTFQPVEIIGWLPWIDHVSRMEIENGHAFIDFGLLPPSVP